MNVVFKTVLLLLFTFCSNKTYEFEKRFFESMVVESLEAGIDVRKELEKMESYLIDRKILKDYNGDSYFNLFEIIKQTNDIHFQMNYSLLDSIALPPDSVYSLKNPLDFFEQFLNEFNDLFKTSKTRKLLDAIDYRTKNENMEFGSIAEAITSVLKPSDFEQDFFKFFTLLFISTYEKLENNLVEFLQARPISKLMQVGGEKHNTIEGAGQITIKVEADTDNDFVLVNGRTVAINQLSREIRDYLLEERQDPNTLKWQKTHHNLLGNFQKLEAIITFQTSKHTIYLIYVEVTNQLARAIYDIRDTIAKEINGKGFEDLSEEEKEAIRELIPMAIQEIESNP